MGWAVSFRAILCYIGDVYWSCVMLCISTCRLHAVATHNTEDFIYNHVDGHLKEVGLTDVRARDLVDVVMGYTGNGYAHSTQEELGD